MINFCDLFPSFLCFKVWEEIPTTECLKVSDLSLYLLQKQVVYIKYQNYGEMSLKKKLICQAQIL